MTYKEILEAPKWREKRAKIINRDGMACVLCKNNNILLDHKGVIKSIKPIISLWRLAQALPTEHLISFTNDKGEKLLASVYLSFTIEDIILDEIVGGVIYYKNVSEVGIIYSDISSDKVATSIIKSNGDIYYTRDLNVHHKYYQEGKLPWEYPDEALVTCCWVCHEEIHAKQRIPVLDENGLEIGSKIPCSRCGGAGIIIEYMHVESGICFQCQGAR